MNMPVLENVAASTVFDPCFIQTIEVGSNHEVVASTIRTSREIVLTAQTGVPVAKAVKVNKTESLTVYGDLVKVQGTIEAPGRTIKIFCRRLEFHAGPDGKSGFIVSGEPGTDGASNRLAAASGKDGIPSRRYGTNGDDGADGEDGKPGAAGGRIEIYCDTLVPLPNVLLKADGGRGGDAATGQQGGEGGRGLSGFTTEQERGLSYGGEGGQGGHGGNGGQGGSGGSIEVHFMKFGGESKKDLVTISVLGGGGGNGASPGKGGFGGAGGDAASGCFEGNSNQGYWMLGGADAGAGGFCGTPGYFGYAGSNGTVTLGVPADVKPVERFQISMAEVLEAGNWQHPEQLQSMSADKQREALVDEINRIFSGRPPQPNNPNRPKDEIDKLTDYELSGRGAVTAYVLQTGLATEAAFAGDPDAGRNTLLQHLEVSSADALRLDNQYLAFKPVVDDALDGRAPIFVDWFRNWSRQKEIPPPFLPVTIAEVLQAGKWLTADQLRTMSAQDQRQALVDRLGRLSNPTKYLTDYELIGRGAVTAFLLQMGIRDEAALKGDPEGGRNAVIVEVAGATGYRGNLQGLDNQQLVRLALEPKPQNTFVARGGMAFLQDRLFGPIEMFLYDVLQAGQWLTAEQLNTMSAADQRQALIDELNRISDLPRGELDKLDDRDLVGRGAVTAFLLQMGIRDEAGLKSNPAEPDLWKRTIDCLEGCRNTLIVEVAGAAGYPGNPQALDNHQLVRTALEPKTQNRFRVQGGMLLLRDRLFGSSRMSRQLVHWDWRFSLKSPRETALVDAVMGSVTMVRPPDKPDWGRDGDPFQDPNERGKPGMAGKASKVQFRSPYDPTSEPGKDGVVVIRNTTRARLKPGRNTAIPQASKLLQIQTLAYRSLASRRDKDQLEMLFQYVRTRYLLTNVQVDSKTVASIMETLVWLVTLTGAIDDKKLHTSAAGTLDNLRQARNVFGKDTEFAAMGSLAKYEEALKTILGLFTAVQSTYDKLNLDLNAVTERQEYLDNVITGQGSLLGRLRRAETDTVSKLKEAVAAIQALDDARIEKARSLEASLKELSVDTQKAIGLSVADFSNLFTQLSFTAVEAAQHKGVTGALGGLEARGALMLVGQFGDMFNKALNNVPSDSGAPIEKKYVVRRLAFLGEDVKRMEDLKKARDGLIKTDPLAENRLQVTREQLESILSNFYERFPSANAASQILDEYVESVTARNEKVDEYNELLAQLCYVRGELDKTTEQQNQAETARKESSNPGLPAMAGFSAALHTHALQRCVEQLYAASRVFTLEALDSYDVFADVLGQMTSTPGELNPAALNTALIDLISVALDKKQEHRTIETDYPPLGAQCRVTLTPSKNPLLFQKLKAGKAGSFTILPVAPHTAGDRNPFAGMSEVRIAGIRCTAQGMTTGDNVHTIEITHPGIETFYTEQGTSIRLHHNPVKVPCRYVANSPVEFVALDEDHKLIGPFCSWIIRIPRDLNGGQRLDLTGLQSITVDFKGKYRPFSNETEGGGSLGV
jgi:hypothetical protein